MDALLEFCDKHKKTILIVAGVLVMAFVVWYIFCIREDYNRRTVSDINAAIKQTGQDLERAGEQLDTIDRGITDSQNGVSRVQERIDTSSESVDRAIETSKGNQGLVDEGRRTTKEIRGILQGLPKSNGKEGKSSN